jgi:Zn-dependent peptidase ImmA (M78 family)
LESADEINRHVDRLLRAADAYGRFPTPVDDIVSAAELEQADTYALDESMIKKAPAYLRTLLRTARSKIQGLVDRRARVIHISPNIDNDGKRRFVKLHETVHHVLPHQQELLFADDNETLSAATDKLFEREANQGAAELLFQREKFTKDAADLAISKDAVWFLADRYGSSFHSALRRYAETHPGAVAAIVLDVTPVSRNPPTWRRREFMATETWRAAFGTPRWPAMMSSAAYPFMAALDHPDLGEVRLTSQLSVQQIVHVDAVTTPYRSFILLWIPQTRRLLRQRRLVVASG